MDNENLLPKKARAVITQNGDRNIAVAHAENITSLLPLSHRRMNRLVISCAGAM